MEPRNILAVTFTNKAAAEMVARVAKFFGKDIAKQIMAGTFHSVSYKLLKELNIHHPEEFFIQAGMPNQLFPDVIPFLTKLQNTPNVKTVILTAGDELFHEMKVRITGASKLVNQVIVTRIRNKTDIIKRIIAHYEPESTVFVDDRIHMTAADFDTPITIYEMDRTHKKEGEFVIH